MTTLEGDKLDDQEDQNIQIRIFFDNMPRPCNKFNQNNRSWACNDSKACPMYEKFFFPKGLSLFTNWKTWNGHLPSALSYAGVRCRKWSDGVVLVAAGFLFCGRGVQMLDVISCCSREAEWSFLSSDKLSFLQKMVVINLFQLYFALCQLCEEHVQYNQSFQ